jgi:hypothetical protein
MAITVPFGTQLVLRGRTFLNRSVLWEISDDCLSDWTVCHALLEFSGDAS